MKRFATWKFALATAILVATAAPRITAGQSATQIPGEKPAIMVMAFESGTVAAQARDKHVRDGEYYDPSQLGIGIADMLVEKLLEPGQFRLLERKPS